MPPVNAFGRLADLPQGLGAWMSTRQGGQSAAPWDSLNLGDHVGDSPSDVRANRQSLERALGVRPVFLAQVHGDAVLELSPQTPDGRVADACFTFAAGVACTIMVADCLPVLFWDVDGRWVAAAHAGWRGLAGQAGEGVLETLWAALAERGARPERTQVWLGPCIGPATFEVGGEVRQAFVQALPEAAAAFQPGQAGRLLADLPTLARQRLQRLGLMQLCGNDGSPVWCTVSNPALFFSHRRDALRLGSSGRMAACIWRA
jgi:YfiH family protein